MSHKYGVRLIGKRKKLVNKGDGVFGKEPAWYPFVRLLGIFEHT